MTEISTIKSNELLEEALLALPQVACPVDHIFGPGIYIRQVSMAAGLLVKGHHHKHKSLNMILAGKLALIEGGVVREVSAPYVFTGEVGSKMAYVIEDCVFQNIFATEETDIEKLEEMFVEKTEAFKKYEELTK
jgi:hypothetical protein